ncbi:phosphoglucosamine mutase [Candidatus Dependentiae bacterium Noda2021]|nr:phosphoglucosamine mutase [Candidatus Dependentiae bacterium Noda2021]
MNKKLFGTDGIRNTVGQFPFELPALLLLGNAISKWINTTIGKEKRVLIGHDTRLSCSMIKSALKTGLLCEQQIISDAGVITTPMACLLTQYGFFDIGIIISASHNPYQDNGIKIVTRNGKISQSDEAHIEQTFADLLLLNSYSYENLGNENHYTDALKTYLSVLKKFFKKDFLHGFKIVLDCAHGASYMSAPYIFKYFGADVIAINTSPDGTNINFKCGSLEPSMLQATVVSHNAQYGFAFDGDGDRVIACNSKGDIKDGDDILHLLATHSAYVHQSEIVGTIMTNQGLVDNFTMRNISTRRAAVGDKYVSQTLQNNNLLLGGEPSGHIIMQDYLKSGDGIFTALRIMQTITENQNLNFDTFQRYPQFIINMPVSRKIDLKSARIENIIANHEQNLTSGRLVVRYSGTENLLRIMAENIHMQEAQFVVKQLADRLEKEHHIQVMENT